MASKRHQRMKACRGKVRYPSMEEAQRISKGTPLNAYYCRFCGGIHRGHGPQRGIRPRRRP